MNDQAAIKSTATFLLDHFKARPCDSDGVASCVRCNAVFLARKALEQCSTSDAKEKST
jgi:hypothetical protein